MTRRHTFCIWIMALLAAGTVPLHAAANEQSALGINLAGVTYWSSEIVFVDLFRHSQTFKSQAPGKSYAQGGARSATTASSPTRSS